LAMDRYSADLQKLVNEDNVNVYRTDASILQAQLESWDRVMEGLLQDPFFAKVVDSQKAWAERVAFYDIMNQADYKLAYDHYFPGKLPF
ncbi:MAG: C4-dicarboxylate ABC transporter, partial [Pseudomonadota bacterium]